MHHFKRKGLKYDSVAQPVEHNTFNVGVLGSSPSRITEQTYDTRGLRSILKYEPLEKEAHFF